MLHRKYELIAGVQNLSYKHEKRAVPAAEYFRSEESNVSIL
jgi:hypothetical protein